MFRKICSYILIITLIFGGISVTAHAESDRAFYVSPLGNDQNAGTLNKPFKTIERARIEVQKYASDMSGDIYVYIREGNYFLDESVTFTESDSGTNGYTIHYKNYNNEKPVIYGGKRIEGWETWQNGIYKTKIDGDADFYALTEDMEWAKEACYPNEGYLGVARRGKSDRRNTLLYLKDEDMPENLSLEGLRVKSIPYLHYGSATWPVTEIDRENNSVTLNSLGEKNTTPWTEPDGLYCMVGNLSFLDTPGEFYIDRNDGWLYYYPYNDNITESVIVAPTLKSIFRFNGSGINKRVKNISVEGLTLSTTDFTESFHEGDYAGDVLGSDAMIKMENAENISVVNCKLMNAGIDAIWLDGVAQNNTISGNFIKNVGYVAVLLSGYTIREAMGRFDSLEEGYCNKNNTITNNYIRRVGINAAHGAGIQLFKSGDNVITHNEISDSPRYAISLKDESHPDDIRCWGIEVPASGSWIYDSKSMIYDLRFSQNNYIAYNDMYDCMKETADGGIFETNSAGRGNVFKNNIIHDIAAPNAHGMFFAIYLDGSTINWRIEDNIVYNISAQKGGAAISTGPGIYNQFTNNIIDTSNGNISVARMVGKNLVFNKNIIYSTKEVSLGGDALYSLVGMENNLYYSGTGEYYIVGAEGEDTLKSWKSAGVYDQYSIAGQLPEFEDAENHNYTLEENSPALKLGIKNVDTGVGLTDDFVWERETNPLPEMIIGGGEVVEDIDPAGSLRLECESAEYTRGVGAGSGHLNSINSKSYFGFSDVDLTDVNKITVRYAVPKGYAGCKVEVRADNYSSGTLLGSFVTEETEDWNVYHTTTFDTQKLSGKHSVYFYFPDDGAYGCGNFDWVRFETDNGKTPAKGNNAEEGLIFDVDPATLTDRSGNNISVSTLGTITKGGFTNQEGETVPYMTTGQGNDALTNSSTAGLLRTTDESIIKHKDFTIETWARYKTPASGCWPKMFKWGNTEGQNVLAYETPTSPYAHKIIIGNKDTYVYPNISEITDAWKHYVFTFDMEYDTDGTTLKKVSQRMYVNGVDVTNYDANVTDSSALAMLDTITEFTIGGYSVNGSFGQGFSGDFATFKIYNGVKSQSEVTALYENSKDKYINDLSQIVEGPETDFGDIAILANGSFLYNCGAYSDNGNIMIPLEETVACFGFSYDASGNTVTDTEGNAIVYTVNSDVVSVNGNSVKLSCNVKTDATGKVYVPAEIFELAFGDCVMYSDISKYCRIFDVKTKALAENPDNPNNDLAWRKTAVSSSNLDSSPVNVLDGDESTVWKPYYSDNEWICIDLGNKTEFNTIEIDWGSNYARAIEIYVSDEFTNDEEKLETIYSYLTFGGGKLERSFEPVTARYVFVNLKCKAGVLSPTIKDIHIYNK